MRQNFKPNPYYIFGHGQDTKGWYLVLDAVSFTNWFTLESKGEAYRSDEDIKAIIFALGGELPSEIESYKFLPISQEEVRVYVTYKGEKEENNSRTLNEDVRANTNEPVKID